LKLSPAEAGRWKVDGVALTQSPSVKKVDGGYEVGAGRYGFEVTGIRE